MEINECMLCYSSSRRSKEERNNLEERERTQKEVNKEENEENEGNIKIINLSCSDKICLNCIKLLKYYQTITTNNSSSSSSSYNNNNNINKKKEKEEELLCPKCYKNIFNEIDNYKINWNNNKDNNNNNNNQNNNNNEVTKCENCEVNNSSIICLNCNIYFCNICDTSIHMSKGMSKHKRNVILPGSKLNEPWSSIIDKNNKIGETRQLKDYCIIHSEKITNKYCLQCNEVVCSECIKLQHNDHIIEKLDDVIYNNRLKLHQNILETLSHYQGILQITSSRSSQLLINQMIQMLENHFNNIYNLLESRRINLLTSAQTLADTRIQLLAQQKSTLSKIHVNSIQTLNKVHKYIPTLNIESVSKLEKKSDFNEQESYQEYEQLILELQSILDVDVNEHIGSIYDNDITFHYSSYLPELLYSYGQIGLGDEPWKYLSISSIIRSSSPIKDNNDIFQTPIKTLSHSSSSFNSLINNNLDNYGNDGNDGNDGNNNFENNGNDDYFEQLELDFIERRSTLCSLIDQVVAIINQTHSMNRHIDLILNSIGYRPTNLLKQQSSELKRSLSNSENIPLQLIGLTNLFPLQTNTISILKKAESFHGPILEYTLRTQSFLFSDESSDEQNSNHDDNSDSDNPFSDDESNKKVKQTPKTKVKSKVIIKSKNKKIDNKRIPNQLSNLNKNNINLDMNTINENETLENNNNNNSSNNNTNNNTQESIISQGVNKMLKTGMNALDSIKYDINEHFELLYRILLYRYDLLKENATQYINKKENYLLYQQSTIQTYQHTVYHHILKSLKYLQLPDELFLTTINSPIYLDHIEYTKVLLQNSLYKLHSYYAQQQIPPLTFQYDLTPSILDHGAVGGPSAPIDLSVVRTHNGNGTGVELSWRHGPKMKYEDDPSNVVDYYVIQSAVYRNTSYRQQSSSLLTSTSSSSLTTLSSSLTNLNLSQWIFPNYELDQPFQDVTHLSHDLTSCIIDIRDLPNSLLLFRIKAVSLNGISGPWSLCVSIQTPKEFNYIFEYSGQSFDENGLLYWIGTRGGRESYQNPYLIKEVTLHSSTTQGSLHLLVNHQSENSLYMTHNKIQSWFIVDLGKDRYLQLTNYSLRTGKGENYKLRNWELHGKIEKNDKKWHIIKRHKNCTDLKEVSFSTASWEVLPGYMNHNNNQQQQQQQLSPQPQAEERAVKSTNKSSGSNINKINTTNQLSSPSTVMDTMLPSPLPSSSSNGLQPLAYRYFRLIQTGVNSSGDHHLVCNGIEFYGILYNKPPVKYQD